MLDTFSSLSKSSWSSHVKDDCDYPSSHVQVKSYITVLPPASQYARLIRLGGQDIVLIRSSQKNIPYTYTTTSLSIPAEAAMMFC